MLLDQSQVPLFSWFFAESCPGISPFIEFLSQELLIKRISIYWGPIVPPDSTSMPFGEIVVWVESQNDKWKAFALLHERLRGAQGLLPPYAYYCFPDTAKGDKIRYSQGDSIILYSASGAVSTGTLDHEQDYRKKGMVGSCSFILAVVARLGFQEAPFMRHFEASCSSHPIPVLWLSLHLHYLSFLLQSLLQATKEP